MKTTKFVITQFKNPSGAIVHRVTGWLEGERIRLNFKTRAEAAAEKSALEIKSYQATSGLRTTTTLLSEEQLRAAEAAFQQIEKTHLFPKYIEFALANYREPNKERKISDAVSDYLAVKSREEERGLLSLRQLRSIKNELKTFSAHKQFAAAAVSQTKVETLASYLDRGTPALKTYNNRRGILSTFFKFAYQQDWIGTNPVEKTPYHRINHRRGSATTLTTARARELLAYLETFKAGALVPYFAICLFAGIRPCVRFGEISKLKQESIRLDTGVIHIEPEVSKVNMKRIVTIQPNLAEWLKSYSLCEYPLLPKNAVNMRRAVFKEFKLTHDVLRHTFISMFVAKYRSMGEAALQAGNSESIIRKHYLDLKSKEEAEEYFNILPKRLTVAPTERL